MATVSSDGRGSAAGRGFTLLEAVVSTTLMLGVLLMISLSLIDEAGRRVAYSGVRANEPDTASILNRMRADVQGSMAIVVPADYDPYAFWYEGPLVASEHWSGASVGYGLSEGTLFRVVIDAGGAETTPVLVGVEAFRWTLVEGAGGDVVMIELIRRRTTPFRTAGGANSQFGSRESTSRLVVAPRRGGKTSW